VTPSGWKQLFKGMAPTCLQHFGLGKMFLHEHNNKHMLIICQAPKTKSSLERIESHDSRLKWCVNGLLSETMLQQGYLGGLISFILIMWLSHNAQQPTRFVYQHHVKKNRFSWWVPRSLCVDSVKKISFISSGRKSS
jgi:hypothetical protein